MPQSATIESSPHATRMMEEMQAQGVEWGEDYRHAAGAALKEVLEGRMADIRHPASLIMDSRGGLAARRPHAPPNALILLALWGASRFFGGEFWLGAAHAA